MPDTTAVIAEASVTAIGEPTAEVLVILRVEGVETNAVTVCTEAIPETVELMAGT